MSALGQKAACAPQKVMSASPSKGDVRAALAYVCFGPKADINDMSGCAATAGERDVSGSAFALRIQRHSTGCDCRSLYCLPKYCLCGSSLRTSDTGSPNTHYLWRPRLPRTMGPRKPELAVTQQSRWQEQRWQLESRESSSASMLDAMGRFARSARNGGLARHSPSC
jgi:hypothetical protein